ncbi:hypothetical protein [Haloparvum sp. PAK95]|uniref:hypothetical protein n=1 Tax=Haloparvum sp. PAK95 TaxID=3418962 RepID=UPI003D2EB25F
MEIDLAAIVRFDFCEASSEESLKNQLSKMYDEEGEQFGGPIMGTGETWRRTIYSADGESFGDLPGFEEVFTLVEPDCRHILDVTTVAVLSDSQIRDLTEQDSSRTHVLQNELMESLNGVSESIPSIVDAERRDPPTVFYIEPAEEQEIGREGSSIDTEVMHEYLEEHQAFLGKFQFLLGHPIEFTGEDLITPQSSGADGTRSLTVLNTTASYEPQETEPWGPSWLRRIEGVLKPYFRTDDWLRHRRDLVADIDRETHGINDILKQEPDDVEAALSSEEDLEALRREWTDVYTKLVDEVAVLREETGWLDDEERTFATPISPPARPEQEVSIFDSYDEHLRELFTIVENDLDRVGQKLGRISQFIHDTVAARTASANVNLQKDIKNLTIILTVLTVVLAILSLVQFL